MRTRAPGSHGPDPGPEEPEAGRRTILRRPVGDFMGKGLPWQPALRRNVTQREDGLAMMDCYNVDLHLHVLHQWL